MPNTIDPLTVACPACASQPAEPCVDDSQRWYRKEPHPERVEAAQFMASVDAGEGGGQVHEATAQMIDDAATERLF